SRPPCGAGTTRRDAVVATALWRACRGVVPGPSTHRDVRGRAGGTRFPACPGTTPRRARRSAVGTEKERLPPRREHHHRKPNSGAGQAEPRRRTESSPKHAGDQQNATEHELLEARRTTAIALSRPHGPRLLALLGRGVGVHLAHGAVQHAR